MKGLLVVIAMILLGVRHRAGEYLKADYGYRGSSVFVAGLKSELPVTF